MQCDGELSAEGRATLALHLEGCAACRAYVAEMDTIVAGLTELRADSERVGVTSGRGRRWADIRRLGGLAAAVAIVFCAGFLLWRSDHDGPRPLPSNQPEVNAPNQPVARVTLVDSSVDRFVAVPRESRTPNVHVFVLFNTP